MFPIPAKAKTEEKLMETPKKDLVGFRMNSPHLRSQEEKTYQMETLRKKVRNSTHKLHGKMEETPTHEQKEGTFSSFSISGETIQLLRGSGEYISFLFKSKPLVLYMKEKI